MNIDRASGPGTHWTALVLLPASDPVAGKLAFYWDPAGYPPPQTLTNSLTRIGRKTLWSDTRHQIGGTNCGARTALTLRDFARCKTGTEALAYYKASSV